jgi:hypothetical protein
MQTIKHNKRTGAEYPVSIKSAWPDMLSHKRRGKVRGSRSKLLGNRENECRVVIKPKKRVQNALDKARADIAEKRAKRNRFAFIARNPTAKAGAIDATTGTIQPRQGGRFMAKVQVKY